MEVIILAGGFGTRLQNVVKNVPKPMAEINGHPFLKYLIDSILVYDLKKIILSVGYKKECIIKYFGNSYKDVPIEYSIEDEPLGTGGAVKKAINLFIEEKEVFVINGDSFFNVNLKQFIKFHKDNSSDISLFLKEMYDFNRYGTVRIGKSNEVLEFHEKCYCSKGYINTGIYVITKDIFDKINTEDKFSFEEFLEKNLNDLSIFAKISNDTYFIDIGIPSDYEKAKNDFRGLF